MAQHSKNRYFPQVFTYFKRKRWPQDGPKMPQDGPKAAPRWPKIAPRRPKVSQRKSQDSPKMEDESKMGARWPNIAKTVIFLRFLHTLNERDGPKMAPRCPKMAPRRPQDDPRWPQDDPRLTQEGPKMAPRWKMRARWEQDGPT